MINPDVITSMIEPLVLEIYLYQNNYKDRLLISEIEEKVQTIKMEGQRNSYFVKTDDVYEILNTKFKTDLEEFQSTSPENLNNIVTSIYFIDAMLAEFNKAKYIRINVSDSVVYNRKVNDHISFNYKIVHSKIDLTLWCTPELLFECQRIFKKLKFYTNSKLDKTPYFEANAIELLESLRHYQQNFDEESEDFNIVSSVIDIFGTKLEKDNSTILVVIEA